MSKLKTPKTRRQKISKPPVEALPEVITKSDLNNSLTAEQRQAIQAMASQGLSKDVMAAALGIDGDLLQWEQLPEWRVGRIANVQLTELEYAVGLKDEFEDLDLKGTPKKEAVLAAFSRCASITKACAAAGVTRRKHYTWLDEDPEYVAAFAKARKQAGEWLRDQSVRRATVGELKALHFQGQVVGFELNKSEVQMTANLKALLPDEFGDKSKIEHTGANGQAIPQAITVRFIDAKGNELPEGEDDE